MGDLFPRIDRPELFFGFVCPIGADLSRCVTAFRHSLESRGYTVAEIKVTDIFEVLKSRITPKVKLERTSQYERYKTYIAYGNQIREHLSEDAILAMSAVTRVMRARERISKDQEKFAKTAYLIHQFKRKEEIDLLRAVYGRLFFQVSVYSRRSARVEYLSRLFARSSNSGTPQHHRSRAEEIVQTDLEEESVGHGQRVGRIFHDADFLVSLDAETDPTSQIDRFVDLLFGSNKISPSKMEYGMFLAKAAALRSLDLSRQVGAAIFTLSGEVIALGSNEVPKASGGTYWGDELIDDRDYVRGEDSNQIRKAAMLQELAGILSPDIDLNRDNIKDKISGTQLMDVLEYSRVVHAEMGAIADAARMGRSLSNGILYCTTFPCHICAKHIIASGLSRVVFLEPYRKSLAEDLHSDAVSVEGSERGSYREYPAVQFDHFYGVSPRRYRELFERTRRKDPLSGRFQPYQRPLPAPILDIKLPFYAPFEEAVLEHVISLFGIDPSTEVRSVEDAAVGTPR